MSYKTSERNLEYESLNRILNPNGGSEYGFPCKNYKLCKSILPEWWFECKMCYICTNCDVTFGTWDRKNGKGILDYRESIECPVCMDENVEGMSFPNCNHFVCIPCLKRCVWGKEEISQYPSFPYDDSDLEDKYIEAKNKGEDLEKCFEEYPILQNYYKEEQILDEINNTINKENEAEFKVGNLGLCPICRK